MPPKARSFTPPECDSGRGTLPALFLEVRARACPIPEEWDPDQGVGDYNRDEVPEMGPFAEEAAGQGTQTPQKEHEDPPDPVEGDRGL